WIFLDRRRDAADVLHDLARLIFERRELLDDPRQLVEQGGQTALFRRDLGDLARWRRVGQHLRARAAAGELYIDDAGDALEHEARPGIRLDGRLFAQPDIDLHATRIVGIELHRPHRAHVDTVELHRIAECQRTYG